MAAPNFILRAGGIDTDVIAWYTTVVAAGGLVSMSTLRAVNQFTIGMKNAGLWQKCYMIDLCCGSNLAAALVRLKVPAGVAAPYTNLNFVNADYSESVGMTGNGTTKCLNSNMDLVSQSISLSSCSLWTYARTTESTASSRTLLGLAGTEIAWSTFLSGIEYVAIAISGLGQTGGQLPSQNIGWLGGGTNDSRVNQYYINGVQTGLTGTSGGSISGDSFFKFGRAAATQLSARTLTTAIIATGLNASDIALLNGFVQAFETALGRNV